MKRLFTLLCIVLSTGLSFAQGPYWQWAKIDTGVNITSNPTYRKQVIAANNTTVLWATLQNSKLSITPAYYGDYKLAEYNLNGNMLNSAMFTGKVVIIDVKSDASGNWYVLGKYNDSLQYGTFSQVQSNMTAPYHFLARLDATTLQMQWYTPIGINYFANSESISLRGGNIYIPVDSYLTTTVYKVDMATGNRTAVVKQVNTGYVSSVVADDNGSVYVAGSCPSVAVDTFGNRPINITGQYTGYIVRYKANGDYDWGIFMHDITCLSRLLNIGDNNTIYYTGGIMDSLTIDTISIKVPLAIFGGNYVAASLDSFGHARWVKQVKDTIISRVDMSNLFNATVVDNSLVIATAIQRYVDFGNGLTENVGNQYASTYVHYDISGAATWLRRTNSDYTIPQHIASNGKDIFVTGLARDTFSLDLDTVSVALKAFTNTPYMAKLKVSGTCPAPVGIGYQVIGGEKVIANWKAVPGATGYEYVVSATPPPYTTGTITSNTTFTASGLQPGITYYICVRTLCSNGSYSEWTCVNVFMPLGIATPYSEMAVNIYPNPASKNINISGLEKSGTAHVQITNITGSVIYASDINTPSSNEQIDVSSYARGMYFIEIKTQQGKLVQKLILE